MEPEYLSAALALVEPYPSGVCPVPELMRGLGFFPGGRGVWVEDGVASPMPVGKVMILGHDFHSLAGYKQSLSRGGESVRSPTWRNLLALLDSVGLRPADCFFTNAYMGLRKDGKATGPFPGRADRSFVARCREFFFKQVAFQHPRAILTLGTHVTRFLSGTTQDLAIWRDATGFGYLDSRNLSLVTGVRFPEAGGATRVLAALTHPSFRPRNVTRRRYGGLDGDEAEARLVRDALVAADLNGLLQARDGPSEGSDEEEDHQGDRVSGRTPRLHRHEPTIPDQHP